MSTLEPYDDPENGYYITKHILRIVRIMYFRSIIFLTGWLKLIGIIGFQILFELDHRKPVLYVIPIEILLGKPPLEPVGDTGTIPHHPRNLFPWPVAPGDRRPGAGDGCRKQQDVVCQLVGNGVVP